MIETFANPHEILAKEPKEEDDGNDLPETEPYEQQDEPSQNGQDPNSIFEHEIGDPFALPLAEALLAGKRVVGGLTLELVSWSGAGPEENGDEKDRPLGDDDEEVEPDPEKESKNALFSVQANGGKEDSSNGGDDDSETKKEAVEDSRDYDLGESTDIGTGN